MKLNVIYRAGNTEVAFHAESDAEAVALKDAVVAAVEKHGAVTVDGVVDELDKAGFAIEEPAE